MVSSETRYEFDLSGGHPGLDLINTVSERTGDPVEHLLEYADLLAFARQSGGIPDEEIVELTAAAQAAPRQADRTLAQAVRLREALYRVFRSIAAGGIPDDADLDSINSVLCEGLARARLVRTEQAYRWSWAGDCSCLERPLWQIVHAAADLLTSPDLERVKLCGADTCEWLFLDESRNRSRRWCDMSTCGNREKARKHYRRVKERAG
jgi:predicted RNA-binding Zn ribbon-like protein